MTSVNYRLATLQDIPALTTLLGELFQLEADFSPEPVRQAEGLRLLITSQFEPEAKAAVWVAEHDGRVAGMCSVQVLISTAEGGPTGLVEDVIVDASCRGQGIGKGLLEAVANWSRQRGLTRLQLLVDRDNPAAQQFYIKHGWQMTRLLTMRLSRAK